MESSKKCTKCGEVKPLADFSKRKMSKDGLKSQCKSCIREYSQKNKEKMAAYIKAYQEANKEKMAAYIKAYQEANKEKMAAYSKAYREANKEKMAAYSKAYQEANKEKIAAREKAYREANREKIAARGKAYREDNKEKIAARQKERYNTDNYYRMTISIRKSVSRWKNGSTIETIGISFQEFADMYGTGEGMHLDHKIPMSWFDVDNEQHCRACQHHTNLQWLTPEENISKNNRYADVNGQKVLRKDFDLEAYVRNMLEKLA
jgi:hypothetical protein